MKLKFLTLSAVTVLLFTAQQSIAQTGWVAQTSGTTDTLNAVQFLDADNGFVCGHTGTVLKTTDGGATWTDVSINTFRPVNDISFINTTTGWAAVGDVNDGDNSGEIWNTTDGGTTWNAQPYNSTRARLGISFIDANTGWACGSRNGPLDMANTTDGGSTWAEQTNGAIFGWSYKVDALSATDIWTVGGAFFPSVSGLIIHSTDGGSSWGLQSVGTIPFVYDVEAVDANTIFTCGDAGYISATTDGGATWSTQVSGTTNVLWSISFSSSSTGLACGKDGTIIGTIDGGATWATETSGVTTTLLGTYMLDGTTAWAVGIEGTILKREIGAGLGDELNEAPEVRIFPNPFNEYTTVLIDGMNKQNDLSFTLFDAIGNVVLQRLIIGQSLTLDRGQLAQGLYHYTITGDRSAPAIGKLLIQ